MALEDNGGGGTPESAGAGAGAGGGSGAESGKANAGADTRTGAESGASQTFSFKEDRSKWIPPHRLSEETGKRTALERELTAFKATHAELDRRFKALAGVTTPSPEDAAAAEVKEAFYRLFPRAKQLLEVDEAAEAAKSDPENDPMTRMERIIWGNRAKEAHTVLFDTLQDAIGGEFSERQKQKVLVSLRAYLEHDPERVQRYEAGDNTDVVAFAQEWVDDFVKPSQRAQLQSQVDKVKRVPSGRDRSIAARTREKPKIDPKDPDSFGKAMLSAFTAEGGEIRADGR